MKKFLIALFQNLKLSTRDERVLTWDNDGLEITHFVGNTESKASMRWDEIDNISAFLRDMITYEEVFLVFDNTERWLYIDETSHPNYLEFVGYLRKRFPEIPRNWLNEINDARELEKLRVLWDRNGNQPDVSAN